jgi:group I intron endonuclease
MFLYVITNRVNGKQYVGIANQPDRRRMEHFSGHGSKLVRQAIRKYARENLDFDVWYEGPDDWIRKMEYYAIVVLGTHAPRGYNLTLGGEGACGWRASSVTRQRMSLAHRGAKNSMWGRRQSMAAREKQRATAKARMKPNHRQKIRMRGVLCESAKVAAMALGVKAASLYGRIHRCKQTGAQPEGFELVS